MSVTGPTVAEPSAGGLRRLFWPESIAIIGATPKPEKISAQVQQVLAVRGFNGRLYGVNASYEETGDIPCFPSVGDLPERVDLAIVVIPAAKVPGVVGECAVAGIPNVIIIASGFGEGAGEGAEHVAALLDQARRGETRISGPNAEGYSTSVARSRRRSPRQSRRSPRGSSRRMAMSLSSLQIVAASASRSSPTASAEAWASATS